MLHVSTEGKDEFLEQLEAGLTKKLPQSQVKQVMRFAESYYATASLEDITERSLDDLYGATLSTWHFIQKHDPNEAKVRVFNPDFEQHGWQSSHTIIEILHKDMPFLVDSVRMELNRRELTVHAIHNAVLGIQRSSKHELRSVARLPVAQQVGDGASGGEALIYIEVDRHTDEQSLHELQQSLLEVLQEVRAAVTDFAAMQAKTRQLLQELQQHAPAQLEDEDVQEACDFLNWLNTHFTFLGYEEFTVTGAGEAQQLQPVKQSELGILKLPAVRNSGLCRYDATMDARQFVLVPGLLAFAKAPEHARVHRPTYPDFIAVKRFDKQGRLVGEGRFLGLYTSTVYNQSARNIPVLRKKIAEVMQRSGLSPQGHSGKQLLQVLEVFPRDDLFQISLDELMTTALGILNIRERRKVRLFIREDAFAKLYSCLVFVPRDVYSTDLRVRMQNILCEELDAEGSEFYTYFSESVLARTQFLLRFRGEQAPPYDVKKIERKIIQCTRSWNDELHAALVEGVGEERANHYMLLYRDAFPAAYVEDFSPRTAVYDIQHIDELNDDRPLAMSFYRQLEQTDDGLCFKVFHRDNPLPLSDVLPILENLGLRVIGEHPYEVERTDGLIIWIHNFYLIHGVKEGINLPAVREIFQETFSRVWCGDAENDAFNRLVLTAGLNWRQVTMLRAYARYMKQIRFGLSQDYIANTLYAHPEISRLLVELFKLRFDPDGKRSDELLQQQQERIHEALEKVQGLSEDRILRRYLEVINATLRTNYFQPDAQGECKTYIALKMDTKAIPELPRPRPLYEVFVYSPRMEGVHLRSGKVARGGLRWSDRLEDFRTEILGLVKAQQVKNAVIVPVGAKGGFVAKCLPEGDREAIQQEGIACYKTFIRGLLDITDNLVGGMVAPPPQVVRHDDDDPYLVVAADKGTATFSDIANAIAEEYGFWLKDAFASGGSAGYDHKKMGITARGAWVSVERHFREMGLNPATTDFTVIGIGDMSGDVFGNGMLLSQHIRLVAAFNHRHIFIDPNPDAAKSFEERRRLFTLPRSGWDDYARDLISEGGGVFSREAKSIVITPQMKATFDIKAHRLTPNELISAILRAPVDLLWNGGIGTYVKASRENHADVGDKANDAVRVNASELRCKVIGEGGNLGLTQLARIEYNRQGGRCNTDFIDNSGGVDCSDHEVNIKILLAEIVAKGDMTRKQRNQLLSEMTDEVAQLVLKNNYRQTQAISLAQAQTLDNMGHFRRLISKLEADKKLDRHLEFLPSDEELQERQAQGLGMTRAALSVLISYTKSYLKSVLVASSIPDDDYICRELEQTFPYILVQRYRAELYGHRLLREIVATQLANDLVNHVGVTFVHRLQESTGANTAEVARAYIIARDMFDLPKLWKQIEALDYQTPATVQYGMMLDLMRLGRRAARWLLRSYSGALQTADLIQLFAPKVRQIRSHIGELLRGVPLEQWQQRKEQLQAENVPEDLATLVASASSLYATLGIIGAARETGEELLRVADLYFLIGDRLELHWFAQQIQQLPVADHWQALARESFRDDLDSQQRALTVSVLQLGTATEDNEARVDAWMERHAGLVQRWHSMLTELRTSGGSEYPMYSVAMRELLDLAQSNV